MSMSSSEYTVISSRSTACSSYDDLPELSVPGYDSSRRGPLSDPVETVAEKVIQTPVAKEGGSTVPQLDRKRTEPESLDGAFVAGGAHKGLVVSKQTFIGLLFGKTGNAGIPSRLVESCNAAMGSDPFESKGSVPAAVPETASVYGDAHVHIRPRFNSFASRGTKACYSEKQLEEKSNSSAKEDPYGTGGQKCGQGQQGAQGLYQETQWEGCGKFTCSCDNCQCGSKYQCERDRMLSGSLSQNGKAEGDRSILVCHWCRQPGHHRDDCPDQGLTRPPLHRDYQRKLNQKEFFAHESQQKNWLQEDRRVEDRDRNSRFRREWEDMEARHADETKNLRDKHFREIRFLRAAQSEEDEATWARRTTEDRDRNATQAVRLYHARRGGRPF